MKVLWTLSPTAVLEFMTKSWAAQSTNINIALASLVQYMCVHKPEEWTCIRLPKWAQSLEVCLHVSKGET